MLISLSIVLLNLNYFVASDCGCNQLKRNDDEYGFVEQIRNQQQCTANKNAWKEFYENMVLIPAGNYVIGTNEPIFQTDQESPEKNVKLNSFYLDKYEVSNDEFKAFVETTNYITDAEKFNDSFVFHDLLIPEMRKMYENFRVARAPWWYKVNGTNWKHPKGPGSNLDGKICTKSKF